VLVITIIVMIILATAIILSLSSSGILGRTKQAKKVTDISNIKEAGGMHFAEYELEVNTGILDGDEITVEQYVKNKLKEDGFTESQLVNVKVHNDGTIDIYPAVIPEGFVVSKIESEQKVDDGLVVYEIPEAERNSVDWTETVTLNNKTVLKVQTEYNQYVWIPVPDIISFVKKYGWLRTKINDYDINIQEEAKEFAVMKQSVEKYGGFYIARYEAGLPSGKYWNTVNYGQNSEQPLDKPLSKKGLDAWTNLWDCEWTEEQTTNVYGSWDNPGIAIVARNAYDTNVKSHLIYDVEWDAALAFISLKDPLYPINSVGKGWFKANSGSQIQKTGKNTDENESNMVNNIYDMAGNATEWTMGTYSYSNKKNYRIIRGGEYSTSTNEAMAAGYTGNRNKFSAGFRVALYIK